MEKLTKEQLEQFWKQIIELDKTVGLNASTMDNVYERVHNYASRQEIDIDELEIEY